MNKTIIAKLKTIINYYKETYTVTESVDDVIDELINNNVEVNGDSFYCPIWSEQINGWVLLAGTKDKADMWVMKKILKLIKSGQPIFSMLNGNTTHLLKALKRYNVQIISQKDDMAYISFNLIQKEL
jgi:hypothetical protein